MYSVGLIISITFAWVAYKQMAKVESQKTLIILAPVDVVIGFLVGRFFPDPLGVSSAGLTILFTVWLVNAYFLVRIYRTEAKEDQNI